MNKPFSLKVKEAQEQIINIINDASLPAYCLKNILQNILTEIENLDNQEVEKYYKELEKEKEKKQKEGK